MVKPLNKSWLLMMLHNDIVSSSTNMTSTTPKTTSITTSESTSISSEQTTTGSSDILPITTVATPSGSTTSTSGLQNSTTSAILTNQTGTTETAAYTEISNSTTTTETSIKNCTKLYTSSNVIKDSELISFNSTIHFKCNAGYKLSGGNSTTCSASGEWSVEPPKCYVIIPSRPTNGSIFNVTEDTFGVAWIDENPKSFTYYDIIIPTGAKIDPFLKKINDTFYRLSSNMSSVVITELDAGNEYEICIYTVAVFEGVTEQHSESTLNLNTYTVPLAPNNVKLLEDGIKNNSFVINLCDPEPAFTNWTIEVIENCTSETVYNETYSSANTDKNVTVTSANFKSGTSYRAVISTSVPGYNSKNKTTIHFFTKPEQINSLTVSNTTNTSLLLKWDPPNEGNVDTYNVSYKCIGPNDGFDIISNESIVLFPTQNTTLSGLCPGTFCIASVITAVGDQEGYPKQEALTLSTAEEGPDVVEAENIANIGSRNIDIQWKRPSKRNGLITKYEISASLNGTSVDTGILNCTVCTMQQNVSDLQRFVSECASALRCDNSISVDSLYYNFTNLHPFRTYTFSITAFTHEKGKRKTMTGKTKEDKPDGPPQNITVFFDTFMLTLDWEPPSFDVRNGIITNYTVEYSFLNKTCYNSEDGDDEYMNQTLGNQTKTNLHNLFPFTDYRIQIKASTSVGYGNYSDIITVRTNQSVPSKIDINRITNTVTSKSITLKWETPCRPNGIITNYTIQIKNTNPSDEQPDSTKITSSNETTETIEGLMPYRNYTISISGNTIAGANNDSDTFKLTTNISKPKTPKHLRVEATSSKELSVTWDKPTLKMYTGPTHYVVVAEDDRTKDEVYRNKVYGFENNNCTVVGLDEYWDYTVTVTAITDAGNATSASKGGRTKEDVPLAVASVEVMPQPNVTLKRSIFVEWAPPTERNQNGIITNYFVEYFKPLERREVFKLPPASKNFTIVNISPGNYIVTVYAATAVGNGTESNKSTELLPGAPLKAPETNENPLMRAGTFPVSNNKKEIPVELPTDSFLCNISNGDNIEWGVVVAQNSEATDTPFNGNKADFEKKKKEMYKTWSIVKEKESIPPYIATHSTWNPCSVGSGTRRRKSTDQRIKTFTVGEDGDCTGRCNGALQPGRNYRVKSYVCTQEGCTETLYSEPIATETSFEEEPDSTIPIVAGVVSALVVISVAGVIVFFLKRRQVACFSKDVEPITTHRAGDEIALDKIEQKQPNASRPGPIKLADFPQAVEKMHRDGIADAYKLLKEKSPSHPLTAAEQQCSRPKNRYTNILPFDHSRVKLRPSGDIKGSDYINANYIPGYSSRREYIATQGPMQATFDDFWRMVWEQNVDTIVMLTKRMEKGRRKCDKYWPDIGEPVYYGDLVVSLQSESNLSDYTIKIFEVKMKEERKVITHFSYLKWPDMGCPETPELLLDFVKAVRQYTNRDKKQSPGPIIVHCSAGVGPTGTFIAVDYLLQNIRGHDDVDIYNLVLEMRNHRLNMVQTEDQYVYIHECLKAFITTDEEEEEEDEEPVYMNTDKEDEHIYVNTALTKE